MKTEIRNYIKKLYYKLPEEFIRLRISYVYNKEDFRNFINNKMGTHNDIFSNIYRTNMWHTAESVSGGGSTMDATITVRKELPIIIEKYNIKSIVDAPCGDYNWMQAIDKKGAKYIGADIVAEIIENNQKLYGSDKVKFIHMDMTKDDVPKVDLIFCKDCMQHLSYENVMLALNNFKRSGSKYLLVSSFPKTWRNHDIYDGDYRPLNLIKKPFCLPKPIYQLKEEAKVNEGVESDKYMYLYEISSIPTFDIKK